MTDISILSGDLSFARMLQIHLEEKDFTTIISQSHQNSSIVIYDFDSMGENNIPNADIIVGISRNEQKLSNQSKDKCSAIYHRPFNIEKFLEFFNNPAKKKTTVQIETKSDNHCYLEIDEIYGILGYDHKTVGISPNEIVILKILLNNIGTVISRESLCNAINATDNGNMVKVYVCHLRDKIRSLTGMNLIRSVRGIGYIFE